MCAHLTKATPTIDLNDAHAVSTGQGVRVAVLDTGVEATHPALTGRLQPGYDFVDLDHDPADHGGPTDAGWGQERTSPALSPR